MNDVCVVGVSQVSMRGFAYYQPALYYAVPRLRDGVVTWRRKCLFLTPSRAYPRAARAAEDYAAENGFPIDFDVKHGDRVPKHVAKRLAELSEADNTMHDWLAAHGLSFSDDADGSVQEEGGVE